MNNSVNLIAPAQEAGFLSNTPVPLTKVFSSSLSGPAEGMQG